MDSVALSRGRGSKHLAEELVLRQAWSPSHGGVDRNRAKCTDDRRRPRSPSHGGVDRNRPQPAHGLPDRVALSRGRGSKLVEGSFGPLKVESPSHGGVDRNVSCRSYARAASRRPLTGAWIETMFKPLSHGTKIVALSRGRGSKRYSCNTVRRPPRRPLTGAWIETRQDRQEPN